MLSDYKFKKSLIYKNITSLINNYLFKNEMSDIIEEKFSEIKDILQKLKDEVENAGKGKKGTFNGVLACIYFFDK